MPNRWRISTSLLLGAAVAATIAVTACGGDDDSDNGFKGYVPGEGPVGWSIYDERNDSGFSFSRTLGKSCLQDAEQMPNCYWADIYGWCAIDEDCNDNVATSLPVYDVAVLGERIFVIDRTGMMQLTIDGSPGKPHIHDQSPNSERINEIEVADGRIFALSALSAETGNQRLVELNTITLAPTTVSELGSDVYTSLRVSPKLGIAYLTGDFAEIYEIDLVTGAVTNASIEGGSPLAFTEDGLQVWTGDLTKITGLWDPQAESFTAFSFATEDVAPKSPELTSMGIIAIQNLSNGNNRRVWLNTDGSLAPLDADYRAEGVDAGPSFVIGGKLYVWGTYLDSVFRRTALWHREELLSR